MELSFKLLIFFCVCSWQCCLAYCGYVLQAAHLRNSQHRRRHRGILSGGSWPRRNHLEQTGIHWLVSCKDTNMRSNKNLIVCSCLLVCLSCALWVYVGSSFLIDPALYHQPATTIDTWSAGTAPLLRSHHHCQCIFYLPRWTQE
jgi:hypothetical protein